MIPPSSSQPAPEPYPQQAYPPQAYPPQPYPQQAYPQQPYPQQPYPQQAQRPAPRKPPASALVGTLLAIAIGLGLLTTMCALSWRSGDDGEKVVAAVQTMLLGCAPDRGSEQTCSLAGMHEGLRQHAAESGAPYESFTARSTEVQCRNSDCIARVRGVLRFGSRTYPATFDLVDDGDGWRTVAGVDRFRDPLLPD